jgi:hypothetical protein
VPPGKRRAERPFPRWIPVAIVVAVLAAGVAAFFLTRGAATTQTENANLQGDKSVLTDQRDAAAGQALDLAGQIAAACASGKIPPDYTAACDKAKQVQAQPIPPVQGAPGAAGRGITGTSIRDGHLFVTYTDNTTADLGEVAGATGAAGAEGRGITGSLLEGGRLVLTYTDGTRADVGQVVGSDGTNGVDGTDGKPGADGKNGTDGKNGRGISSVEQVGSRLVITYTDGTTQDAGPLPAGPACPSGSSLQSVTYADGRSGLGCVLDQQPATQDTTDPDPGEMPGG